MWTRALCPVDNPIQVYECHDFGQTQLGLKSNISIDKNNDFPLLFFLLEPHRPAAEGRSNVGRYNGNMIFAMGHKGNKDGLGCGIGRLLNVSLSPLF